MTPQERERRAEFVNKRPAFILFVLYSCGFVGTSASLDLSRLFETEPGSHTSTYMRYVLPAVVVLPIWIGIRQQARRILKAAAGR
jgi:hypothetical protein